jgi:hypothetical protein
MADGTLRYSQHGRVRLVLRGDLEEFLRLGRPKAAA